MRTPTYRLNLTTLQILEVCEFEGICDSLEAFEGGQIQIRAGVVTARTKLMRFGVQKGNLENLKQGSKP